MDPNAALAAIRAAAAQMQALIEDPAVWEEDTRYALGDDGKEAAESLVEHVQALDEWLSRGGFLPDAWARG